VRAVVVVVVVWRYKRRAVVQVMPYSNAVNTPLSNFEANLNYKDATDPSVVVTFPVVSDPGTAVVVCEGVLCWLCHILVVACAVSVASSTCACVPSVLQS
jgi:hypothetical protein